MIIGGIQKCLDDTHTENLQKGFGDVGMIIQKRSD